MNVLIAGGSGMLGRAITEILLNAGHQVGWLSRSSKRSTALVKLFTWNPENYEIDPEAIHWPDAVINLAGESIGDVPWTKKGKEKILQSRIQSVKAISRNFQLRKDGLKSFVGVSGAGYYGAGNQPKSEEDGPGKDFPAQVARAWEEEYDRLKTQLKPDHFSLIRLSVVLSNSGGALPRITQPIQYGFGSVLGSGKQPFNWIHIHDAAQIFVDALQWNGVFNASAPGQISNAEVTSIMAEVLHRKLWLPAVPEFALRIFLGERADLVLQGNHSNIEKLIKTGFKFRFPDFRLAVQNLYPDKK
jgi:hypothetical protein